MLLDVFIVIGVEWEGDKDEVALDIPGFSKELPPVAEMQPPPPRAPPAPACPPPIPPPLPPLPLLILALFLRDMVPFRDSILVASFTQLTTAGSQEGRAGPTLAVTEGPTD